MNFAVLESGPFRKDRMSVWNPGREDVMMKGFVKIFQKSRESTGRSGRMLEKAVCDSDRIEQSILRGVFTTGKKSVRCKNPGHFSVICRRK